MTVLYRVYQLLLAPVLLGVVAAYRLRLASFTTLSRFVALFPGEPGVWVRRVWYRRTLNGCGENLYVDWMAAFRTPKTSVGSNVYVGTFCWIGWASLGNDVMLGGHITVLSGAKHHAFDRLDVPMREQAVNLSEVRIGNDVWIGDGAIIMADVASGTVVGAGAVVTKTFEPNGVVVGVPGRCAHRRTDRNHGSMGDG